MIPKSPARAGLLGQVVIASITMGCRAVSPGADLRPDRAHLKDDFLDEIDAFLDAGRNKGFGFNFDLLV